MHTKKITHKKLSKKLTTAEYKMLEKFFRKNLKLSWSERFKLAENEGFIKGVTFWNKNRLHILRERLAVDKDYKKCCKIFKCNKRLIETIASKYNIPRPKISKNWGGVRRGESD